MSSRLNRLKNLIEEYGDARQDLDNMAHNWSNGDAYDQACSDPGLQYAKELECEVMYENIVELCQEIADSESSRKKR